MGRNNKLSIRNFFLIGGLPTYLLLLYPFFLAFISRQRDLNDVTTIDTSALSQIIFSVFAFLVSMLELRSNKTLRVLITKTPVRWFLYYIIFCFLSVFWSIDFNLTLYRAFENMSFLLLICASFSILYNKYKSPSILIYWVLYYAILLILTGTLKRSLLWGLPLFSIDTLLLEQMNSAPFFFLVLLLPVGWFLKSIIVSISIFSLSNTAYLGMLFGSLGISGVKRNIKIIFILIFATVTFFILFYDLTTFLQNTIFYGKDGVGFEYTSGRDAIYELAINEGMKKPLLGYGFVAGDTYIISANFERIIGAHNGFLSAFLGTGIFGLILFIWFFIKTFKLAKSKFLPKKYKAVFSSSIIFVLIYTFGNPGLGTRVFGSWISSTIIIALISIVYLHFKRIIRT